MRGSGLVWISLEAGAVDEARIFPQGPINVSQYALRHRFAY